ncbi:MAG: ABC transporter ATP-binding protein [Oscillospiraceae bacterium]|jgi:ABC-2 type transport system ATP-binding protein|nr:MAG: ABC transporter ATP-binding protein [Oscillospiraceae bacterium]
MNKVLSAQHITKNYGKKQVLHDVSIDIEPGIIYGLIGRNGAGKTTLLSILTAQNTWDTGTVTYGDAPVWENAAALADICFSRELSPMMMFGENTYKVRDYLKAAATYYPYWDEAYAQRLVQRFGLETKKRISKLSKGMLSMVTIILALASRAPITILDEPVAGLDVVAREDFYKLLLEDYTETGRTFVISTHIIEEAANVFEKVIVMKDGAIAEVAETESFVGSFSFMTGKDEDVAAVCARLGSSKVLHTEHFGRQTGAALRVPPRQAQAAAEGRNVDISPVNLQKAFVYLAGEREDAPC